MLIEFKIKNFTSYYNENIFSMETGERLRKYNNTHTIKLGKNRVLKNSIIFGANASGKSNLFFALSRMRTLVLHPTSKVVDKLPYTPYKFKTNEDDYTGTTFEILFFYEEEEYAYKIKYNKESILHESLNITKKNGQQYSYFYRDVEEGKFIVPDDLEDLVSKTRDNSLFVSVAQNVNDLKTSNILKWFSKELIIFDDSISDEFYETLASEKSKKSIINFLSFADLNISDIEIRESITEIPKEIRGALDILSSAIQEIASEFADGKISSKELYLLYNTYSDSGELQKPQPINLSMDSSGTRKLLIIALTIVNSLNSGKTIVMDEFDSKLHLKLAKTLIKLFNTEKNNNQYILSSHELQLLDSDLRVDQIWMVEKDYRGISSLYSLFDFNSSLGSNRTDVSFFSRYMKGQFGAIPTIDFDGMFESIIDDGKKNG